MGERRVRIPASVPGGGGAQPGLQPSRLNPPAQVGASLWIRIDLMRIRIQHFPNCGSVCGPSSESRVLMTKYWKKIYSRPEKNWLFF
jgi:hypothetical protein